MFTTNTKKRRRVTAGSSSRPNALPPERLEPVVGLATTPHNNKRVRYDAGKAVVVNNGAAASAIESEISAALKLHKSMTKSTVKQEDITRIISAITGGEESVLVREVTGLDLNNWNGLTLKSGRTTFTDFVSFAVKANNEWSRWAIPVLINFGALANIDHLRAISNKKNSNMEYIEAVLASLKSQSIAVPTDMVEKSKAAEMRAAFEQHNQSPEIANANTAAAASAITTTVDSDPKVEELEEPAIPAIFAAFSSSAAPAQALAPLQNADTVAVKDSYEEKTLAFLKISKELEDNLFAYMRLSIRRDIFEEALYGQLRAYSASIDSRYSCEYFFRIACPIDWQKFEAASIPRKIAEKQVAEILGHLQKSMHRSPLQDEIHFWRYTDLNTRAHAQVKNHTDIADHQHLIRDLSNNYVSSCNEITILAAKLKNCLEDYFAARRAKICAYNSRTQEPAQQILELERSQIKSLFRQVHNATVYHQRKASSASIVVRSDSSAAGISSSRQQAEQILSQIQAPIAPQYALYRSQTTTTAVAAPQAHSYYGQQPQQPYYVPQYAQQSSYGYSYAPAEPNASQQQQQYPGYEYKPY